MMWSNIEMAKLIVTLLDKTQYQLCFNIFTFHQFLLVI